MSLKLGDSFVSAKKRLFTMKSVVITVTYKTSRIVAVSSFVSPSPNSKMSQFSKFETKLRIKWEEMIESSGSSRLSKCYWTWMA